MKKTIQIRQYADGKNHYSRTFENGRFVDAPYTDLGVIKRKLRAECIGNFNPVFCTYKGKRTLVHSASGDLSDPFRREESYLASLFIEIQP